MTAKTSTCVALSCNTCGEYLSPDDDGGERHFADLAEATAFARDYGWIVHADGFAICDAEDPEHSGAMRELMPPEPMPVCDGQAELPLFENGAAQ